MAKALTEEGPDVIARMATEASARRLNSLRAAIVCVGGGWKPGDCLAKNEAKDGQGIRGLETRYKHGN